MNTQTWLMIRMCLLSVWISPSFGWESHQSHFMDADAEALIDEALAGAYGQIGALRKQQSIDQIHPLTVEDERYQFNCHGTNLTVGGTTISPGSETPDEVNSTTVVLGNVIAMDLCQ